jgi:hypothetical protein
VAPKNTFPMLTRDSFLVPPGVVTRVELSGERTQTDPGIREGLTNVSIFVVINVMFVSGVFSFNLLDTSFDPV